MSEEDVHDFGVKVNEADCTHYGDTEHEFAFAEPLKTRLLLPIVWLCHDPWLRERLGGRRLANSCRLWSCHLPTLPLEA